MEILGYDLMTFFIMLMIFLVSGVFCGAVTNWALGRKLWFPGGLIGGALVGFLLLLL